MLGLRTWRPSFRGVSLEEILRQFQAQGMGGGFPGGFGGGGGGRSGGGTGGMPGGGLNFNLSNFLSNLNPQMLLYALPLLFMALQALSSLFSLIVNYWYILLILPLVPAQYRKQALMMIFMYCTMGGFLI